MILCVTNECPRDGSVESMLNQNGGFAMKSLIGLLFLVAFSGVLGTSSSADADETKPSITVTEDATIDVVPDRITVLFGIETRNMDLAAAMRKNSDILKAAIAAAKECGVQELEIQTDQLSILPDWVQEFGGSAKRGETFNGYIVRNSIAVNLGDAARAQELITNSLAVGVNYVLGVDFQTTEGKKYREQAREVALKAVKEKAEKMAAALGNTVGAPIQIFDDYLQLPQPQQRRSCAVSWGHDRGCILDGDAVASCENSSEPAQTVALGKLPITARVRVVFELK
jgi:uncharacterized protein YggE